MIRDKVSAHRSQLEPALLMRQAEVAEHHGAKRERSLAASEGVAKRKVYESFVAGDRSVVDNRHLKWENPRPCWSTRVQMLIWRTSLCASSKPHRGCLRTWKNHSPSSCDVTYMKTFACSSQPAYFLNPNGAKSSRNANVQRDAA